MAEELLAGVEVNIRRYLAENALQESQQALKESNEAITEALLTKNKFFSVVAHDIKNPLWAILGSSEMLTLDIEDCGKDDIKSLSESINNLSHRLLNLLENLLNWSHSELNSITYNPSELNLRKEVENSISILKDIAQIKKVVVMVDFDSTVELVGDQNMLSTIIRNLTSNAIKFTPVGGKIAIFCEDHDSAFHISVTDTGVGISEKIKQKLSRRDENITTTGTNKEKGTGLGLLLCKEFVGKHGGKIWVESEVGKGSIFTFSISKF